MKHVAIILASGVGFWIALAPVFAVFWWVNPEITLLENAGFILSLWWLITFGGAVNRRLEKSAAYQEATSALAGWVDSVISTSTK